MFDIGFWEIVLISVIGLIVLGPERLPIAIRTVLRWVNTAKSMANSVTTEISHELKLHEMNENMIKASKKGLSDLDPELQQSIDKMKQTAQQVSRPYKDKAADRNQAANPCQHDNSAQDDANKQDNKDEYK